MSYLTALLLGLVQGLAEFLPISSSGHLAVFQNVVHVEGADLFFDVLLHFGTLIAIFAAYWKEIVELVQAFFGFFRKNQSPEAVRAAMPNRRMILLIIVATLPLVLVLPIKDKLESLYNNLVFIGFALIVTGLILFFGDRVRRGKKTERDATLLDAVLVGLGQALAVVPGLSRSGTTISAGMVRGFDREFAVRFSFILSIPAVLGANLLSLVDAIKEGVNWSLMPKYLLGVIVAMVSGYAAISFLKYITRKSKFGVFAYYCWGAGLVTLILSMVS